MLKAQDIVVLLKWVSVEKQVNLAAAPHGIRIEFDPFSVRGMASALGISKTEIGASLNRSVEAGLAIRADERIKPHRPNMLEFIVHGLKYAFPAVRGAPVRGVATAFAAPMLKRDLISGGNEVFVWPHAAGSDRGPSIVPLYKSVPEAALHDVLLYEYLALIDALRLGNQRESKLAAQKLEQGLLRP